MIQILKWSAGGGRLSPLYGLRDGQVSATKQARSR
jgi:hypothetical protein